MYLRNLTFFIAFRVSLIFIVLSFGNNCKPVTNLQSLLQHFSLVHRHQILFLLCFNLLNWNIIWTTCIKYTHTYLCTHQSMATVQNEVHQGQRTVRKGQPLRGDLCSEAQTFDGIRTSLLTLSFVNTNCYNYGILLTNKWSIIGYRYLIVS